MRKKTTTVVGNCLICSVLFLWKLEFVTCGTTVWSAYYWDAKTVTSEEPHRLEAALSRFVLLCNIKSLHPFFALISFLSSFVFFAFRFLTGNIPMCLGIFLSEPDSSTHHPRISHKRLKESGTSIVSKLFFCFQREIKRGCLFVDGKNSHPRCSLRMDLT